MIQVPSLLKKGDKVAIVAPAGKVDKDSLEYGLEVLRSWGLIPVLGKYVYDNTDYFSSTLENRLADFQWALDNEEVKAIFCARGGYGSTQIINKLSFHSFLKSPKWIIGYSDITVILNKVQQLNVACIHGPMPASFGKYKNKSVENLRRLLFE